MSTRKSALLSGLICILTLIISFAPVIQAKSLYVGMHNAGVVSAYKILGDQIQYQTNSQGASSEWTGITLDPDSGIAFATTENNNYVYLLNAKTMIFEETQTQVNESASLAGIVFDSNKQKLYVVGRQTNHLFTFYWDPISKILLPDGDSYIIIDLGSYPYAYGTAIDDEKNHLYVTNSTNTVHYFDIDTWAHKGSIPIVVGGTQREAVGIAIDSKRHYMYTGSFTGTVGSHTFLVRTDINNPNNPTSSEKI